MNWYCAERAREHLLTARKTYEARLQSARRRYEETAARILAGVPTSGRAALEAVGLVPRGAS